MLIAGTKPGDRWYRERLLLSVTCVDTCFASGGYGLIAGKIAHAVRSNPKMSAESAVGLAE